MKNSDRVENLSNGATVYGHEASNTIVIHNPNGRDMGTVYQNSNIQNKMNNLVKNSKK
jgi:hypothetical protein